MSAYRDARPLPPLRALIKASRNGLPSLQRAVDSLGYLGLSAAAEVALLESCVQEAVGQFQALVTLSTTTSAWEQAPDDTLLCDLPDLLPGALAPLIARALEPPLVGVQMKAVALLHGYHPLPFMDDLLSVAHEMTEGLTIGEVRSRATV